MMRRLASQWVGLAFLALATSGCVTQQDDGVFGPASGLGDAGNAAPALSLKATPARGPGPLEVDFSLSARDRDGDALEWALDFGDRTAPAAGTELPATPSHTYRSPGAYVARFTVKDASGESVSTLSIVVLEGIVAATDPPAPTQGPAPPPQYQPPPPAPPPAPSNSTSATGSSSDSGTTSPSATPTSSQTNSTTGSSSSTTSAEPTPSSSSSSSSGTSSSTGTETFSDPGTSTSDSGSPTPEPTPTGSESQTSSEPPL